MPRYVAFVGIVLLSGVGWITVLPSAPLGQPIAFSHAAHAKTACATCHRGAASAAHAGIPQGDTCLKCHATAPRARGAADAWPRIVKGDPIRWVRVTRLPEHVMFSHRRHVTLARLECASCHGDVARQTTPVSRPAKRLEMKTCLSCHRRENASEDCAACHR